MSTTTQTIGFPRIGSARQLKTASESYWKGLISEEELLRIARHVEEEAWLAQKEAGIQRISLDGTLYDQMLDTIHLLGIYPARFKGLSGLSAYYAAARGAEGIPALDMSKYMDSNYHYEVPELDADFTPTPDFSMLLHKVARGQALLGKVAAIPSIIGPLTLVLLAKRSLPVEEAVSRLLPSYGQLLRKLQTEGVPEVQVHEPVLASDKGAQHRALCESAYASLAAVGCPLDLVVTYDDVGAAYPWLISLPVAALTLDFLGVPGAVAPNQTLSLIRRHGFPADKRLGVGIIDGRSPWADDANAALAVIAELRTLGVSKLTVTSSVSLQHLPYTTALETSLPKELVGRLSFAVQKLSSVVEVATRATAGDKGTTAQPLLADADVDKVPTDAALFSRPEPYEQRREKQPSFPPFPTTSIGSFPQTAEVRRQRAAFKKGTLTLDQYHAAMDAHIAYAIGVQDALGIDVPVHGEAERTDMVEYFGQQLEGLAFTSHGWVQSYGSRYVRPPLLIGNVEWKGPMTVREYLVAQRLTSRPVKGMLTGPVTILNWSFPRKDISRRAQALQLAAALRQEVEALEKAGCKIIQVDEPALREGLPLKAERWEGYLTWAVDAFRFTTAVAQPETQIVTHLCYSEFQEIMDAVDRMDADVLTIENSRSGDEMVKALAAAKYSRDLGPGVYDVHSPVVPSVGFMASKLKGYLETGILAGRPDHVWVLPDCGLKTRDWAEVIPSIKNMVEAAHKMRAAIGYNGKAADEVKGVAGHHHQSGGACCK